MVDETIEKAYNEFFGNIRDTYIQAKEKDPSIKLDDVKKWFEKNKVRKTNLAGYNSFIADHAEAGVSDRSLLHERKPRRRIQNSSADGRYLFKVHGSDTIRDQNNLRLFLHAFRGGI
jgi:uncharacterized protein YjdB